MENANRKERLRGYIRIARFDHWIKQFFILPGVAFAAVLVPNITFLDCLPRLILGGLGVCLIASANYVINEWLDAEFDQFHPVKKNRPAVAGYLKAKFVYAEYAAFALAGLGLAYAASFPIFLSVLALLIMGVVYNVKPMRSKDIPYLDVLSESVNNALRLLIGWFMVTSDYFPPSTIILGYWMGGAFLMGTKRFAEYRMIGDANVAGLYRKSFVRYTEKSLLLSSFFYALLAVFFCGIFMVKYRIELLLSIPFLCGLFCYYLALAYREDSPAQKPEDLFRVKGLMLYLGVFIAVVIICALVDMPFLQVLQDTALIGSGW